MTYSLGCVSCGATVRLYGMPAPSDPPQCYQCEVRGRRIFELLSAVPGGTTPGRAAKLRRVLAEHPNARVQICADERTGRRYGLAACRRGRAVKLGYRTYHYQIWAVWDAEEVHLAKGPQAIHLRLSAFEATNAVTRMRGWGAAVWLVQDPDGTWSVYADD